MILELELFINISSLTILKNSATPDLDAKSNIIIFDHNLFLFPVQIDIYLIY